MECACFYAPERGLPDHFVRLEEDRRGNRDPEHFGRLEVDNQLELRRLLDWQVARFGTFQDLIDKDSSTPEHLENIWGIGNEASRLGIGSSADARTRHTGVTVGPLG